MIFLHLIWYRTSILSRVLQLLDYSFWGIVDIEFPYMARLQLRAPSCPRNYSIKLEQIWARTCNWLLFVIQAQGGATARRKSSRARDKISKLCSFWLYLRFLRERDDEPKNSCPFSNQLPGLFHPVALLCANTQERCQAPTKQAVAQKKLT